MPLGRVAYFGLVSHPQCILNSGLPDRLRIKISICMNQWTITKNNSLWITSSACQSTCWVTKPTNSGWEEFSYLPLVTEHWTAVISVIFLLMCLSDQLIASWPALPCWDVTQLPYHADDIIPPIALPCWWHHPLTALPHRGRCSACMLC